jgi:hypothetical protein
MKRYKYLVIDDDGFKKVSYDLSEGIVKPDLYLKDIEDKLSKILDKIENKNYNLTMICLTLSSALSKNKISFKGENKISGGVEEYIKFGINGGATKPDKFASIRIYCNPLLIKLYKDKIFCNELKKWFIYAIKHELVHRGQNLLIRDTKLRAKVMSKEHISLIKDLADKQEIMARAWEIIELFKLKNFNKNEIKERIIEHDQYRGISNTLDFYFFAFGKNSSEIKLLYKYMYFYLLEGD